MPCALQSRAGRLRFFASAAKASWPLSLSKPQAVPVRVQVTVGSTTWATSIFPDTKARSFVLPVKKAVRSAEGLTDGDPVEVALELLDPP
mgnify:CR=1 FL=1